jgi:hypothetical protein
MSRPTAGALPGTIDSGPETSVLDMVPPPFQEDLRRHGLWTDENQVGEALGAAKASQHSRGKDSVYVRTRISATLARILAHIVEKKIIPGVQSQGDILNAATFFYVGTIVDLLNSRNLSTEMMKLEEERRIYATRLNIFEGDKFADLLRKSAYMALECGDATGARLSLRNGRHFMERLPEGTQERFRLKLYGDPEGLVQPEHWDEDRVAKMWDEVLEEVPDAE